MATKLRAFRLDDERWDKFSEIAKQSGLNASQAITGFVDLAIAIGDVRKALQPNSVLTSIHTDVNTDVNPVSTAPSGVNTDVNPVSTAPSGVNTDVNPVSTDSAIAQRLSLLEDKIEELQQSKPFNVREYLDDVFADKYWRSVIDEEKKKISQRCFEEINNTFDNRLFEFAERLQSKVRSEISKVNLDIDQRLRSVEQKLNINHVSVVASAVTVEATEATDATFSFDINNPVTEDTEQKSPSLSLGDGASATTTPLFASLTASGEVDRSSQNAPQATENPTYEQSAISPPSECDSHPAQTPRIVSTDEAYAIALSKGFKGAKKAFMQRFVDRPGLELLGIKKADHRGKYILTSPPTK